MKYLRDIFIYEKLINVCLKEAREKISYKNIHGPICAISKDDMKRNTVEKCK